MIVNQVNADIRKVKYHCLTQQEEWKNKENSGYWGLEIANLLIL